MNILIAALIGLLAGAHAATWGMYKDCPYEGFTYRKYFRSILLSGFVALVIYLLISLDLTSASSMIILFGLTYVTERALGEFYKTFIREEDQSKYFIPQQLHVRGRIVDDRRKRWGIGAAYMAGVLLVVGAVYWLQCLKLQVDGVVIVLAIGSVGGWISAFGGGWKDAPIEGFELFKFFRSPAVSLVFAILIACMTESYLHVVLSATGYTIATIETYKTFFFPSRPRGKFAGKPIQYPEMVARRKRFVPLYVAIWLGIIVTYVVALLQPHSGLISLI